MQELIVVKLSMFVAACRSDMEMSHPQQFEIQQRLQSTKHAGSACVCMYMEPKVVRSILPLSRYIFSCPVAVAVER